MKNRQEINQKIVFELSKLVNKYPDMRFGQLLSSFEFIIPNKDEFYIEPNEILKRVYLAIKKVENNEKS